VIWERFGKSEIRTLQSTDSGIVTIVSLNSATTYRTIPSCLRRCRLARN